MLKTRPHCAYHRIENNLPLAWSSESKQNVIVGEYDDRLYNGNTGAQRRKFSLFHPRIPRLGILQMQNDYQIVLC